MLSRLGLLTLLATPVLSSMACGDADGGSGGGAATGGGTGGGDTTGGTGGGVATGGGGGAAECAVPQDCPAWGLDVCKECDDGSCAKLVCDAGKCASVCS